MLETELDKVPSHTVDVDEIRTWHNLSGRQLNNKYWTPENEVFSHSAILLPGTYPKEIISDLYKDLVTRMFTYSTVLNSRNIAKYM